MQSCKWATRPSDWTRSSGLDNNRIKDKLNDGWLFTNSLDHG